MENSHCFGTVAKRRLTQQRQRRSVHEQPQVPRIQAGRSPQDRLLARSESHSRLEESHQGHSCKFRANLPL